MTTIVNFNHSNRLKEKKCNEMRKSTGLGQLGKLQPQTILSHSLSKFLGSRIGNFQETSRDQNPVTRAEIQRQSGRHISE